MAAHPALPLHPLQMLPELFEHSGSAVARPRDRDDPCSGLISLFLLALAATQQAVHSCVEWQCSFGGR